MHRLFAERPNEFAANTSQRAGAAPEMTHITTHALVANELRHRCSHALTPVAQCARTPLPGRVDRHPQRTDRFDAIARRLKPGATAGMVSLAFGNSRAAILLGPAMHLPDQRRVNPAPACECRQHSSGGASAHAARGLGLMSVRHGLGR